MIVSSCIVRIPIRLARALEYLSFEAFVWASLIATLFKNKRTPAMQPLEHSKASVCPPLVVRDKYLVTVTKCPRWLLLLLLLALLHPQTS
jgi:hypothetical protein